MMTVLGYIAVLGYVFFLIFILGEWVQKRTNLETSRKIIHTMLFGVWILIDVFFRHTVHQIVIPVLFLALNALSFRFHIYKSVEREENNHLGTVYFAMAITAIMTVAYFWPQTYLASGLASFCLTFGDGFAALIGYNFPSSKVRESKTELGFGACFAASAIAMACFKLIWWPQLPLITVVLLAGVAAVAELTQGGVDNFTLTFAVFDLGWLMGADPGRAAQLGVAWALLVFWVVFFSGAIDYAGSMLAMIMVFSFRYWGGGALLGYLLVEYFTIFAVGHLRKHKLHLQGKHGRRFVQILINGGLGTLCMVWGGLTGQRWLIALAMTAIGGCFIDSLSSDVGCMSAAQPWDPLRRRHVAAGLSGGVTALGTGAAAMGSAAIGIYAACVGFNAQTCILMTLLVFAQTLLDTVMGSLWQVKYRCGRCGAITEKHLHCDGPVTYARGLRWMNNNMVNLLSSTAITLVAALLLHAVV